MQDVADHASQTVLAARIGARAEQPAAAFVVQRLHQSTYDARGGFCAIRRAYATALEFAREPRSQRLYARRSPAFKRVVREALQPAVHDGADMPRRFSRP